jgi:hypothetical protein
MNGLHSKKRLFRKVLNHFQCQVEAVSDIADSQITARTEQSANRVSFMAMVYRQALMLLLFSAHRTLAILESKKPLVVVKSDAVPGFVAVIANNAFAFLGSVSYTTLAAGRFAVLRVFMPFADALFAVKIKAVDLSSVTPKLGDRQRATTFRTSLLGRLRDYITGFQLILISLLTGLGTLLTYGPAGIGFFSLLSRKCRQRLSFFAELTDSCYDRVGHLANTSIIQYLARLDSAFTRRSSYFYYTTYPFNTVSAYGLLTSNLYSFHIRSNYHGSYRTS